MYTEYACQIGHRRAWTEDGGLVFIPHALVALLADYMDNLQGSVHNRHPER